jgi:hypothetical protein
MYAAVGADDRIAFNAIVCPDFHAFENGVRMTSRELLDLMSGLYAQGNRYRWSVTEEQVEIQGDPAVVAFVNHGAIIKAPGANPTPRAWLETVILRRGASGWRVAFLHSNRTA